MTTNVTAPGPAVSADSALARLVDELTARLRSGETADPEALIVEHPQYAEQLRRLLPAIALLAELSASAGQSVSHLTFSHVMLPLTPLTPCGSPAGK